MEIKTKMVAFSGWMCSGKTTMAEYLVEKHGFKRVAIGDQIKNVVNMCIEDQNKLYHYLDELLPSHASDIFKELIEVKENMFDLANQTVGLEKTFVKKDGSYLKNEFYRKMCQDVGNVIRAYYGETAWLDIFMVEVEKMIKNGEKIVCDDVRLKAEKGSLEEKGFKVFRLEVDREEQKQRIIELYESFKPETLKHKTEVDLDHTFFPPEFKINTSNLTKEECFYKIKKTLTSF